MPAVRKNIISAVFHLVGDFFLAITGGKFYLAPTLISNLSCKILRFIWLQLNGDTNWILTLFNFEKILAMYALVIALDVFLIISDLE